MDSAGEVTIRVAAKSVSGGDGFAQAHLLPYGLRTVDGSYNNLLPGRENWGAADQSFPGIFTPIYLNDDGDRYDFNPLPNMETWYTNNDYGNAGTRTRSQPGPGSGTVIDADPRIISNLIVDQTLNNPAAIAAALTHVGMSGQPLMTALGNIVAAKKALDAAIAAAEESEGAIDGLEADVSAAELALGNAEAAAVAASAQAATDQTAFEAIGEEIALAMAARDTSLGAYVALLSDATPNGAHTAEIAAAFALYKPRRSPISRRRTPPKLWRPPLSRRRWRLWPKPKPLWTVDAAVAEANAALDGLLEAHGVEMDGNTVYLPNVSPDEGLSSPFNGWMTIFGQFFDHGLDLVAKGGQRHRLCAALAGRSALCPGRAELYSIDPRHRRRRP